MEPPSPIINMIAICRPRTSKYSTAAVCRVVSDINPPPENAANLRISEFHSLPEFRGSRCRQPPSWLRTGARNASASAGNDTTKTGFTFWQVASETSKRYPLKEEMGSAIKLKLCRPRSNHLVRTSCECQSLPRISIAPEFVRYNPGHCTFEKRYKYLRANKASKDHTRSIHNGSIIIGKDQSEDEKNKSSPAINKITPDYRVVSLKPAPDKPVEDRSCRSRRSLWNNKTIKNLKNAELSRSSISHSSKRFDNSSESVNVESSKGTKKNEVVDNKSSLMKNFAAVTYVDLSSKSNSAVKREMLGDGRGESTNVKSKSVISDRTGHGSVSWMKEKNDKKETFESVISSNKTENTSQSREQSVSSLTRLDLNPPTNQYHTNSGQTSPVSTELAVIEKKSSLTISPKESKEREVGLQEAQPANTAATSTPAEDWRLRRRRQMEEYVFLRLDHQKGFSGRTNIKNDLQLSRTYKNIQRVRTIRSIYNDLFPQNRQAYGSSQIVPSLGPTQVTDKLELMTKIRDTKRKTELRLLGHSRPSPQPKIRIGSPSFGKSYFGESLLQSKQKGKFNNISKTVDDFTSDKDVDLKGPLKYLFNLKSRLREHTK